MTAPTSTRKGPRTAHATPAEVAGNGMRARIGDEIVVRGTGAGVVTRDGEIVAVRHLDGSPPYDVRWSDTGRVTLYFPGPDSYVKHLKGADSSMAPTTASHH